MFKLSLEALRVLDEIDRQGSFGAAADKLHKVPSAITYIINKLEQDLDVTLYDRTGHRARLTPAGQALLSEGRHLLRAATALESRVKRVASGWETEISIAMDTIFPVTTLYPLVEEFNREGGGTRVRLSYEVLGGTWDALLNGRADLAVGAGGEPPTGFGLMTRAWGEIKFVFCVAPNHPLAAAPEPLSANDILWHRAVVIADTSRNLPVRTVGVLSGQDTLVVPDMQSKVMAQIAGLGCGYLPSFLAEPEIAAGRLIAKTIDEPRLPGSFYLAWRGSEEGKALKWWLARLNQPICTWRI